MKKNNSPSKKKFNKQKNQPSNNSQNKPVPTTTANKQSQISPNVPEYNVLLLGETGAGKSTTINAIANYLKFNAFVEAKNNHFVHLIPSKFTLPDPKTRKPREILSGTDENECHTKGSSSTQTPKAYKFQLDDCLLRIIDTPGVGDTSGADVDKQNFEKILNHLLGYEHLHGICFLIKSHETRKTAYFRYCITELLTHLHKSASENIIFCFTWSRASMYGPGEGYSILEQFLEDEIKDVKIELKVGENCFFIDNEAYRFLVAKKSGYEFAEKQEVSYLESWDESVKQTNQMWDKIKNMPPHELRNTSSLNNARKMILVLAEPMVQLQKNIQLNIEQIKTEEQRVANSTLDRMTLASTLMLQVDDLEMIPMKYPTTICTDSKCTDIVQFQGNIKMDYKTRCHENCLLKTVETNVVGHEILRQCTAMGGTLNCGRCGCAWQKHMHIRCKYARVRRPIIDTNKEKEIKSKDDAIKKIKRTLESMRKLVTEYQDEYKVIQAVCSKFAYILCSNSITPYNLFIEPYLDMLIEEEKKKCSFSADYSRSIYNSLVEMKETHRESVKILTNAIQNKSAEMVKLEDIQQYRDQLCHLKHSGPQFLQIIQVTDLIMQDKFGDIKEQIYDLRKAINTGISWMKDGYQKFSNLLAGRSQQQLPQQQPQANDKSVTCYLCERVGHRSIHCRWETAQIRAGIVKLKELCPICLIPGHELMYCTNLYVCTVCSAKHSATICSRRTEQLGNKGKNFQPNYSNKNNEDRTNSYWRRKN